MACHLKLHVLIPCKAAILCGSIAIDEQLQTIHNERFLQAHVNKCKRIG